MSDNTRVAWTEGMFLRPQHFQQSDKHFSHLIKQICNGNLADPWGILDISIDTQLLSSGQFAISHCQLLPLICYLSICLNLPLCLSL
ncbi:type VI secretion system baseplate subunit TssK [Pseudoalteromonas sp. B193]